MSSKTKKLTAVLFAFAAAVCMTLALFFGMAPRTASAATADENGVLAVTDADLMTEDGVITGLTANAKTEIAKAETKSYTLTISGSATKIADDAFKGESKMSKLLITSTSLESIGKSAFAMSSANNTNKLTEITIPASVTKIDELAFAYRNAVQTINFNATECGDFAVPGAKDANDNVYTANTAAAVNPFRGVGATAGATVNIGNNVQEIPAGMFLNSLQSSNNIAQVNFNNVTLEEGSFGNYSFYNCNNLKTVVAGNASIHSIGNFAFTNCTALTSVSLPSLNKIGDSAFNGCTKLAEMPTITVTTIGDSAFENCYALSSIALSGTVTIEKEAFNQCSALSSIVIPDTVTAIGESAFKACANLNYAKVNYDAQLGSIGKSAFENCTNLKEIIIPQNVKTIGNSAYAGCTAVTKIDYYATDATSVSGKNEFNTTNHPFGSVGSAGNGIQVTIGSEDLTQKLDIKLPGNMFYSTSTPLNITSVAFRKVKTDISANAFANCTKLSTVTFGSGDNESEIGKILSGAFMGCQMLTDFDMPSTITAIGENAFQSCSALLTVKLPASLPLTGIGTNAFDNCKRLFVVIDLRNGSTLKPGDATDGKVAYYAVSVLNEDGNGGLITSADANLGSIGLYFVNTAGASATAKYALIGSISTLTEVVLPDSVPGLTNVGYDIYQQAFQNNSSITSVEIPATVGKIGDHAFENCKSLTTVIIKEVKSGDEVKCVTEIGTAAFAGCTALTKINLPSKLNTIESSLFQNCTSLTEIVIPSGVDAVGSSAFSGTKLTEITIPAGVTMINSSAFENCDALAKVTFESTKVDDKDQYSLKDIGFGAFQGCTSLVAIVIPESVTNIDRNAFNGASKLTTVYLPKSSIYGTNVFNGCNANLVLISSGKDTYASDLAKLGSNVTYTVKVKLVHNGDLDNPITVDKLYGKDYSYELQDDKITWLVTPNKLPVQEGYSKSVWYEDGTYETLLTESRLTALLAGDTEITIYAQYFAKPTADMFKTLNYEDFAGDALQITYPNNNVTEDQLAEINRVLFKNGNVLLKEYNFSISAFKPVVGGNVATPNSVQDAGTYTIEITLKPAYGEWATPCYLEFTVDRQVIDISQISVLNWVISNANGTTTQLSSEKLWLPISGEGDPYLAKSDEAMPSTHQEQFIEQSVVRYNGLNWNLIIASSDKFTISEYNHRNERNIGIYNASAVITPTNNYVLRAGNFQYGMSCVPNNTTDGSYTVYKEWYIVAMANTIWMPNDNEVYHIDGWTYNQKDIDNVIPGAPLITYGEGAENEYVTFTLDIEVDGNVTNIVTDATYNEYTKWINKSMPAGNYTLRIDVKAPQSDVADMHEIYNFTVAKANYNTGIAADIVAGINEKLNGKQFAYAYDGRVKLAYEEIELILNSVDESSLNPNRTIGDTSSNGWASNSYNSFFGGYAISYNISTMVTSNAYLPMGSLEEYAPTEAGVYAVYYQLSAPNYEPLSNINTKGDYSFTVVIYEQVDSSSLVSGAYTYTGEIIVPVTNNEKYQVISIEAGETIVDSDILAQEIGLHDRNYTDVGTPKIVLKLTNSSIYKWNVTNEDSAKVFGANKEYLLLSFEIAPCNNATTKKLDIIRWSWGSYDPAVNLPIWTTKFGQPEDYTFVLTSVTNSRNYAQENFGNAPAGDYILKATAKGHTATGDNQFNYNWNEFTDSTTISIYKAYNSWDVTPTIYGWSYGEYANRVAGPAAKPHFGDASSITTSYYKLNAEGAIELPKYDSLDKLLVDGEVPVGNYLMRVEMAGNSNYNAMPVTDIPFRVDKAYNGWVEVPLVVGWSEGHFNKVENALNKGVAKFGEIIIKVTDKNGKEVDIENFGKLAVGNYTVTAYVAETDDYYAMDPITTTFAVVEDSVSMTGLIAATMVFAVLAVGLAVVAVVFLIIRGRQIEDEFRKMIKKELRRK